MPENKSGRRIIAITVSPGACDEIQRLKERRLDKSLASLYNLDQLNKSKGWERD